MAKREREKREINETCESTRPFFACFAYFAVFAFSLLSQSGNQSSIDGRWNMTLETDLRRIEIIADIRVDNSGSARLVIISSADGEDGLFTGKITNSRLLLKGSYDRKTRELDLTLSGDRLTGKMTGDHLRADIQGQRPPPSSREVSKWRHGMLFDAMWNGINKSFYDPKLNGIDQAAVRRRHLKQIKAARDDGELTVAVRRMLRELQTSHTDFYLSTGKPTNVLKAEKVAWKQIGPSAGYLALRDFTAEDFIAFDRRLDKAMGEAIKQPALVLDLRGNRGESLEEALHALNFLLPEGRPVAYFVTRDGMAKLKVSSIDQVDPSSLPSAFIDDQAAVLKFPGAGMYRAGGKYMYPYRGRIAVLIDESCLGSCELFAAAMKEAGVATLIGRRTRGAALIPSPVTFEFGTMLMMFPRDVKGWRMDLPAIDVRTAGKMKIEGKGVNPDIPVERSQAGDADLERAMRWLEKK